MAKLSDELINISTMLMVAQERGDFIRAANALNEAVIAAIEAERKTAGLLPQGRQRALSADIKFTKKEVDSMSKTFKKEFIANGCVAHIIKRPSGKSGVYYEIRYRRNGYNITVSNKDLPTAKELFIKATHNLDNAPKTKKQLTLKDILYEWLRYKNGKVTDRRWRTMESYATRYIPSALQERPLKEIRTGELDTFMRTLEDKPRTYEEVRGVLNQTFKYAVASGLITHNPLQLIPYKKAERQPRSALSAVQIKKFFKRLDNPELVEVKQCALTMYFFGLRPCEIDDETHIEGDFLITRNRKRKKGKIEYKKIPVPAAARNYIDFSKPLCYGRSEVTRNRKVTQAIGDGLTPYSLRHTFSTICQKYVRPDIVDIWMGDSPERLVGKYYTHFDDDFMREQMAKVQFVLP